MHGRFLVGAVAAAAFAVSGCNPAVTIAPATALGVNPVNSAYTVGLNHIGIDLRQNGTDPVENATVSIGIGQLVGQTITVITTEQLQFVGAAYGNAIPVYLGTVTFPTAGQYGIVVHATLSNGKTLTGTADLTVTATAPELAIGQPMVPLKQQIAADVTQMSIIDSGVPPDKGHTETVAEGLVQHQPMVLYIGAPGNCTSHMCGPTDQIVQELSDICVTDCAKNQLLFEHIETHIPAWTQVGNPVLTQIGLTTDPWVFFVNKNGIVSDRFEEPVTLGELQAAAAGTLAGKVPASG